MGAAFMPYQENVADVRSVSGRTKTEPAGLFAVTGNVRGKSVMLVDDIFTTGATFSAAAAVLKEAGAVTVTGLAFCGSIENLR